MLLSNTPSHPEHYAEFISASRKTFDERIQGISGHEEKLEQLASIQKFSILIIKDGSLRRPMESKAVQQGLDLLWHMFLQVAQIVDADDTLQDKLVTLLLWTKEFDQHCKSLHPNTGSSPPSWDSYGFAQCLQREWNQLLTTGATSQQRNLAAFSAKSLAIGVSPDVLGLIALSYLREALETDNEVTAAAQLPAAVVWIDHCRDKLLAFSAAGRFRDAQYQVAHPAAPGVLAEKANVTLRGYSLERWLFWRQRLQRLSRNADITVVKSARQGFLSMITCGRDLDYEVPGEAKFVEKLQVVMAEALAASGKPSVGLEDINIDVDWVD